MTEEARTCWKTWLPESVPVRGGWDGQAEGLFSDSVVGVSSKRHLQHIFRALFHHEVLCWGNLMMPLFCPVHSLSQTEMQTGIRAGTQPCSSVTDTLPQGGISSQEKPGAGSGRVSSA